ncbi:MAG: CNNM domain-containing protein [bacterium]
MTLLLIYLAVALGFSFLCSIAEAVLLSVTTAYVGVLEQEGRHSGAILRRLRGNMDASLSAILSLNTIAHTVGAAGVGAQSAVVFGSQALGITSGVLTFLILIFSEIIPKTLGTTYWRKLAPACAYFLVYLIRVLYPLVWMSKLITKRLSPKKAGDGFRRDEFLALIMEGERRGVLDAHEVAIMKHTLALNQARVMDIMTPASVIFSLSEDSSVDYYFGKFVDKRFSRIPLYRNEPDNIIGFALRADILLARARGNGIKPLSNYCRPMQAIPDRVSVLTAYEQFLEQKSHIMYVVDEYGSLRGIVTMEDILETLTGIEITDEGDTIDDMRLLAKRLWRKRAAEMGIELDATTPLSDGSING